MKTLAHTLLAALLAGSAFAANGLVETDISANDTSPSFLTAGPDGNLWASESGTNNILRIDPATGAVTRFDTGSTDEPTAICAGPDGNLWFGSALANLVGRITPAGVVTSLAGFGTAQTRVLGICAGPDGNLWFTQFAGQRIGRVTTASAFTDFILPAGTGAVGICAASDGNLWFTEFAAGKIGRITTGGSITHFNIPTPDSGPLGICAGPADTIWFTQSATSKIGVMDIGGTVITEYALPPGSRPNQIVAGPDDNVWFTMLGTHRIGRITTGGTLTQFATPTPRGGPDGIAVLGGKVFVVENFASALTSVKSGARLLSFSTSRVNVAEKGAVKLGVIRTGNPSGTATATATSTADTATAGTDFTAISIPLALAAGASAKVAVPIVDDGLMEANETFTVTLEATGNTLIAEPSSVEVTIVDSADALFTGSAGSYSGLVNDPALSNGATGFLKLKITASGKLTGKLTLGGSKLAFTGKLDSFGDFTREFVFGTELPRTLTLHLDAAGNGTVTGRITGLAIDPSDVPAFALERTAFTTANPAPQAGTYTALLFTELFPAGRGFGTMIVNAAGLVRFTGFLGDATPVSVGGTLNGAGKFTFFSAPYTPRGFISGTVTFQASLASVADGTLRWLRPANPASTHFPGGFDTTARFLASAYTFTPGTRILTFPATEGNTLLSFTGGNLPLALPDKTLTLKANNKITLAGTEPFTMKIDTATGLFTGTVLDPSSGKPRPFSGAVYQQLFLGSGLFPGSGETGRIDLLPAP